MSSHRCRCPLIMKYSLIAWPDDCLSLPTPVAVGLAGLARQGPQTSSGPVYSVMPASRAVKSPAAGFHATLGYGLSQADSQRQAGQAAMSNFRSSFSYWFSDQQFFRKFPDHVLPDGRFQCKKRNDVGHPCRYFALPGLPQAKARARGKPTSHPLKKSLAGIVIVSTA